MKVDGNKKGMGDTTSAHPCYQAFALPRVKDKQRSQPTPSDIIYSAHILSIGYGHTRKVAPNQWERWTGYISPTQTLIVALHPVTGFKCAKFELTEQ